jgi:hypothetical protein
MRRLAACVDELLSSPPDIGSRSDGIAHGIILSEHEYSSEQSYIITVPIFPRADFDQGEFDIEVEGVPWLTNATGADAAYLSLADLTSPHYHRDVSRPTTQVVDDATMLIVERALIRLLGL